MPPERRVEWAGEEDHAEQRAAPHDRGSAARAAAAQQGVPGEATHGQREQVAEEDAALQNDQGRQHSERGSYECHIAASARLPRDQVHPEDHHRGHERQRGHHRSRQQRRRRQHCRPSGRELEDQAIAAHAGEPRLEEREVAIRAEASRAPGPAPSLGARTRARHGSSRNAKTRIPAPRSRSPRPRPCTRLETSSRATSRRYAPWSTARGLAIRYRPTIAPRVDRSGRGTKHSQRARGARRNRGLRGPEGQEPNVTSA